MPTESDYSVLDVYVCKQFKIFLLIFAFSPIFLPRTYAHSVHTYMLIYSHTLSSYLLWHSFFSAKTVLVAGLGS